MARQPVPTRERIVAAAGKLFYAEGIGRVSVDAVAAKAGVTKRTLYYHFRSKDDLITACLDEWDQPSVALFQRWFAETQGELADKVRGIFSNLALVAQHPKWKGCGFLRTAAELAHMPGHPAIKAGADHKMRFEDWIRSEIEASGIQDGKALARQISLLLDGAFSRALLHRDSSYMTLAGEAAALLADMRATRR